MPKSTTDPAKLRAMGRNVGKSLHNEFMNRKQGQSGPQRTGQKFTPDTPEPELEIPRNQEVPPNGGGDEETPHKTNDDDGKSILSDDDGKSISPDDDDRSQFGFDDDQKSIHNDDDQKSIHNDDGPPVAPHERHNQELFEAIDAALDAAKAGVPEDDPEKDKKHAEIDALKAGLERNCDPEKAQEQAVGVYQALGRMNPNDASTLTALDQAIQKHDAATHTEPNFDEVTDGLRTMIDCLEQACPSFDINDSREEIKGSLLGSLQKMLEYEEMNKSLCDNEADKQEAERKISELQGQIDKLNNIVGREPTSQELGESLDFMNGKVRDAAREMQQEIAKSLREFSPDQQNQFREKFKEELATLDRLARGESQPKLDKKDDEGKVDPELKKLQEQEELMKKRAAYEEHLSELKWVLLMAKKMRDFILQNLI